MYIRGKKWQEYYGVKGFRNTYEEYIWMNNIYPKITDSGGIHKLYTTPKYSTKCYAPRIQVIT